MKPVGTVDTIDRNTAELREKLNTTGKVTVICGANKETLEDMKGISISMLRRNMREVLNVGFDHTVVLVNGREVGEVDESKVILDGDEEVEFVKPSGEKG